jgi:hypothetical protein
MSLHGYGLTWYVVESSLGVPTGYAGKLRWQTAGMFSEAAMAEPWDGVGKAVMAGTHKAQEGKTVITAVLTVMSSMDPHMIRWNLRWVWIGFGWDGLSK